MANNYSNVAQATTLSAAVNAVTTTIPVVATTGFPGSTPYTLCIDMGTANEELVSVTSVDGLNLTVTRAYDGTTAVSHLIGATVTHVHSAKDFKDSRDHEAATDGVHGVTGDVVGTTDTQTLTNKDLSSGTNTFPASLATDAELAAHEGLAAAHGATGAVVGTTNVQTLTNKTLTSPTINTPTITSPTITGVGQRRFFEKAASESVTSSAALQDDNHIAFSVEANAKYAVTLVLYWDAASGGGIQTALSVPADTTYSGGGDGEDGAAFTGLSNGGVFYTTTFGAGAGNARLALCRLLIDTDATAGTVTLMWAQASSNATATRVLATSHALVERVA